ncbi:MAG: peptidylprolyl isomerase [Planctomycetota bacterium]|mgnify:FL=1|nr:MAG: peptidylprolyl isomerase [Planctomycetota bacterium]REJ97856.1 MAG: peptidylprolyl isomerase [Planctomycetota bacterium]
MSIRRHHAQQAGQGRIRRRLIIFMAGMTVVATAIVIRYFSGDTKADAAPGAVQAASAAVPANDGVGPPSQLPQFGPHDPVAVVNGQAITHGDLSRECLKHYGSDVLETLTNRYLIALECRKRNFTISDEEVQAEIARIAKRFGIPVDQWLTMLQNERNITPYQYASEIIWPTLALKRLASDRLVVSEEEIQRAMLRQFGPQVHVRLIMTADRQKAQQLHQHLVNRPEEFAKLARTHSSDVNSASAGGLIQPIRHYSGDPKIEAAAFALQDGQVSDVLEVGDQFVILKCEGHIEARPPSPAQEQEVRQALSESLREGKLREASGELFKQLQESAEVVNVWNNPDLQRQMPGVAATINGHPISISELAQACVERHGPEVLDGQINRALLGNALTQANLSVTREHLDAEVARAAKAAGVVTNSGQVHIAKWIEMAKEQHQISEQVYYEDIVWPTVALKLLVGERVQVTDEEMNKSFEANYGPRVRCRAIMVNNQRRAQEVWDMARREPTVENFAKLAEQYSVLPSGKALGGEIPPIQMHGGQETLEREAFSLQTGEISGVIQLATSGQQEPQYVILFCEGRTKPVVVERKEVEDVLYEDLLEKKFRVVMASHFQELRDSANIENYIYPATAASP